MKADSCPNCGITYDDFRTNLTFAEVKEDMFVSSDSPADWVYKRRHSVLGRWHAIKKTMWQNHLEECKEVDEENDFSREKFN